LIEAVRRAKPGLTYQDAARHVILWIDDGAVGADTLAEMDRIRTCVEEVFAEFNVDVKCVSDVSDRVEYVGMELDCRNKRWRMKAGAGEKLARALELVRKNPRVSIRNLYRLFGSLLWGVRLLFMPLSLLHETVECISACGQWIQTCAAWVDGGIEVPDRVLDEMEYVARIIKGNPWQYLSDSPLTGVLQDAQVAQRLGLRRRRPAVEQLLETENLKAATTLSISAHTTMCIFTDAAPTRLHEASQQRLRAGVGAVLESLQLSDVFRQTYSHEDMFFIELAAVDWALRAAERLIIEGLMMKPSLIVLAVDNQGVYWSVLREKAWGRSAPLILSIHETLARIGVPLLPVWIRTDNNPADEASRLSTRSCRLLTETPALPTEVLVPVDEWIPRVYSRVHIAAAESDGKPETVVQDVEQSPMAAAKEAGTTHMRERRSPKRQRRPRLGGLSPVPCVAAEATSLVHAKVSEWIQAYHPCPCMSSATPADAFYATDFPALTSKPWASGQEMLGLSTENCWSCVINRCMIRGSVWWVALSTRSCGTG
jgi:hypothetical protein